MARFLFVVRFRDRDGHGDAKSFKATATSAKKAGQKIRQKGGRVISVRKKKRLR